MIWYDAFPLCYSLEPSLSIFGLILYLVPRRYTDNDGELRYGLEWL